MRTGAGLTHISHIYIPDVDRGINKTYPEISQPGHAELQKLWNIVEDRKQGDGENVAFPHGHAVTKLKRQNIIFLEYSSCQAQYKRFNPQTQTLHSFNLYRHLDLLEPFMYIVRVLYVSKT